MRSRMYRTDWGRFTQSDVIGYAGGNNLYAYVGNDPLNNVDPNGLQEIPPDRMAHILGAHGAETLRSRSGNSVFSPEFSNPASLQQLSNDAFAGMTAPPEVAPYGQGTVLRTYGQVTTQDQSGATIPYPIGLDANKNPTNRLQIDFDKATGNVQTMYPVPMTGSQAPQSSNTIPGADITPVGYSGQNGSSGGSNQGGGGNSTQQLK
jgi:uncharacterized protein RhaS with RHS repeats